MWRDEQGPEQPDETREPVAQPIRSRATRDHDKFNQRVLPLLQRVYGANLWVLCDVHHRAKFFEVHEITEPVWGPQNILKDEFIARIRSEIAKRKSK